jgi:hypothetical protein
MPSEDADNFMRLFVARLYGFSKALGDSGLESFKQEIGWKGPEGTAPVVKETAWEAAAREAAAREANEEVTGRAAAIALESICEDSSSDNDN